jgi:hypothetical protein
MSVGFQPLLHRSGERQIHVVAAQQDVVADSCTLQRQIAALL